ncbi:arylsulfatase [Mycolicibacterium arabiense]|uniref:arylsulfatase n=1 Tax=Mycolicibacterium arabiense TaxID=1286181 RepID=UPI0013D68C53|nr:arylsulfatase [Mycolicibacterium arabiense]MCV7372715.1 arylsulfatase [Mycolicibacterium arabiense]
MPRTPATGSRSPPRRSLRRADTTVSSTDSPVVRRDILPIPDVEHVGLTTYDAKDPDTSYPPIKDVRPPEGAPNVLVILIDDVGFGASSAFGGPCQTPNFERLADGGLRYNRFHTTALCSPTRQALLTGRNHHSVGMGNITETATAAPGYTSVLPNTKAPLALTLKLNGYATAQFGKCHEVPVWQTSPAGPFTAWPTGGGGFEYFYGFIGGENNQWDPALYEGTVPIEPPKTAAEGYHLTEDLTDKAITWVRQQKALLPDKPFFMYFAPGATHAPHHVPKEWIEKYRGKFAHGWDRQREITFERQKELGVIPPDAVLTPRDAEIPAWDDMDPALKPALERQMEVYAAFMEHTDHHVGRLLDSLGPLLDDTLVYLIVGDNGASAEGTLQGAFNEMANFNGMADIETPEFLASKIDEFGGEGSYGHYAVGWAWAMDSPYQWTKQVASHWGGTRNGTIVHWPNGIEDKGGHRNQFAHVIDVAPTVLEAAGIPAPTMVNGVMQSPIEGTSMLYSFADADAPERHQTQYFEMFCNRGIYHKGWSAVTKHRTPWAMGGAVMPAFDDDVWELYDGNSDWTQANDLSKEHPDKLHELQRLWLIEAVKYNVLPLDDRQIERINPATAGRPSLIKGNSQMLFAGMGRLSENSVVDIKNKSFAVTSEVDVPAGGADGVIIAQGGRFGGWSLYAKDGRAKFHYNVLGIKSFEIVAVEPIPTGTSQVRIEFGYDGGGMGRGGDVTLYYDGREVGSGRVEQTQGFIFSADETTDVGYESGTTVSPDYTHHTSRFSGRIEWVRIDLGEDARDADHYIDPEERFRVAMARQ